MAQQEDPMQRIPPQHQDIVNSTWSQLLNAEGGVENLAVDLLKSFAGQSLGGNNSGPQRNVCQEGDSQQGQQGNQRFGGNDLLGQLGGLAEQFLNNRKPDQSQQRFDNDEGNAGQHQQQYSNSASASGGGGNFFDQFGGLGNLAGMVSRGLGRQGQGQAGSSGGGNIMQSLGGLSGLAAMAGINLNDPSSLLKFFMKTPVANDAADPNNSSRDIYKTIKNVIFSVMGEKLPAEDFQENPQARTAWKGYLDVIAQALQKVSSK